MKYCPNNPFPVGESYQPKNVSPTGKKRLFTVAVTTVIKALQALTKCILMDDLGLKEKMDSCLGSSRLRDHHKSQE
jgi:hypothetical protein